MDWDDVVAEASRWWAAPGGGAGAAAFAAIDAALAEREAACRRPFAACAVPPGHPLGSPAASLCDALRARLFALLPHYLCRDAGTVFDGRREIDEDSALRAYAAEDVWRSPEAVAIARGPEPSDPPPAYGPAAAGRCREWLLAMRSWIGRLRHVDVTDACGWDRVRSVFWRHDSGAWLPDGSREDPSETLDVQDEGHVRGRAGNHLLAYQFDDSCWVTDYGQPRPRTVWEWHGRLLEKPVYANPGPFAADVSLVALGTHSRERKAGGDEWYSERNVRGAWRRGFEAAPDPDDEHGGWLRREWRWNNNWTQHAEGDPAKAVDDYQFAWGQIESIPGFSPAAERAGHYTLDPGETVRGSATESIAAALPPANHPPGMPGGNDFDNHLEFSWPQEYAFVADYNRGFAFKA